MYRNSPYRLCCAAALLWFCATALHAQDPKPQPAKETPELPTIADEPKTIDPADFMPAKLAAPVTVDFTESSLSEVLAWMRDKQKLVVLLENDALSDIGILPGDPVADRLDEAPLYQLLNRLRSLGLAWYFEDDILHVTSAKVANERLATVPYSIGDLVDAGYDLDTLGAVIESAIAPASWENVGGTGALSFLGDVVFVRQTDSAQREIGGLLAALRKHGRQTFTLDPPRHLLLRRKLEEDATVAFRDTPLEAAVEELATKMQVDIRLDTRALQDVGVRQRQPISLSLSDRKLKTVLQAMLIDLDLTWILRDGVLWITTQEVATSFCKTAVYDVSDLCRDDAESGALQDAIVSQTPSVWDEAGGPGTMQFPRSGTLVIHNTERTLGEVLQLLETYRTALRNSKPRQRPEDDPNKIVTVYYRMHANVAEALVTSIPTLVQPESWKTNARPEAPGEVMLVPSEPELSEVNVANEALSEMKQSALTLITARSVLIIRQTRTAHDEIAKIIRRVESGDPKGPGGMGGAMGAGMGAGMGGGFGGGYF